VMLGDFLDDDKSVNDFEWDDLNWGMTSNELLSLIRNKSELEKSSLDKGRK
jgi:hypothetical protein